MSTFQIPTHLLKGTLSEAVFVVYARAQSQIFTHAQKFCV